MAPAPAVDDVFDAVVLVVLDVALETLVDNVVVILETLVVVEEVATAVLPVLVDGTH